MAKEKNTHIGVHDLPISNRKLDKFGVTPYIEALSDFITECETPITIALQGGWGTGKTSFMNLINKELKPVKELGIDMERMGDEIDRSNATSETPVITVNFNTWQYTQFHLQDNLGISFLSYMVQKLSHDLDNDDLIKKARMALKSVSAFGMNVLLSRYGLSVPERKRDDNEVIMDPAQAIESLKTSINSIVKQHLDKYKGNSKEPRLVIFIDDLDRLNPRIAVELLEVIKLFLDIEGCVFVLAVDNRVIEEGIKDSKNTSIEKTRSFLDKMIQVPFKVPVETYKYNEFLKENLGEVYKSSYTPKELENLIRNSLGSNPRALKRLINNYYLNNKVNVKLSDSPSFKAEDQSILIAIICMQLSHQPLYVTILNSKDEKILELIEQSEKKEEKFMKDLKELMEKYSHLKLFDEDIEGNFDRYVTFLSLLRDLLVSIKNKYSDQGDSKHLSGEDLDIFVEILKQSELTSGTQNANKKEEKIYSDEIIDVDLKEFAEKSGQYKLETKPFHFTINGERIKDSPPKNAFKKILDSLITEKEHILKLKNFQEMKKLTHIIHFPLLPDGEEKTKYEETYSILKFEVDGEEATIGYHFSSKESARHLYRISEYLEPGAIQEFNVKLKARELI